MTEDEARDKLEEFRIQIDDLDRRIVDLLSQRTRVVEGIGRVKRESHLPIYEPKREEQVFTNLRTCNCGPLSPEALKRIYERIMDEMRIIQRQRMAAEGDKK